MAAANADDSMGVAVEVRIVGANAEDEEISDIENEINYPSHAEVDSTRTTRPSWLLDTRNAKFAGPSRSVAATAAGTLAPHNTAPIVEASTSQLNARTSAVGNIDFAQFTAG